MMDWAAIASVLADRTDRPMALLDSSGRIKLFNRAMEQLLGWTRFEVDGRDWLSTCTPSERIAQTLGWLDDALRGAVTAIPAPCVTATGHRLAIDFDVSVVGQGAAHGLLLVATAWRDDAPRSSRALRDVDYEVADTASAFGALSQLTIDGERQHLPPGQPRCHAVLRDTDVPCSDCPLAPRDATWPKILVRHVTRSGGGGAFEVRTAERVSPETVRVRIRTVDDQMLEAIHLTKVNVLAERADLSPREREVLTYLILGQTTEGIASLVGIAERTVKYHQANLLTKLGAESRADLLRVLF